MFIALWLYVFFMLVLGIMSYFKVKNYKDFALAGANQNTLHISLSLLAGIIGSSATFGMVSLTAKHGFPAFWWLGTGAFFLMLQAVLLAKPVRQLNAYSLPHIAQIVINKKVSLYISFIIVISWVGIIAAQFTALGQLISVVIEIENPKILITAIAITVTVYTMLGGQLSVLRTDVYQFLLLFSAVFIIFLLIYFTNYYHSSLFLENIIPFKFLNLEEINNTLFSKFELLNEDFNGYNLFYLSLIVGLAYFVGPDIFSRNLSAKNAKTAQRSTFIASFFLMTFSLMITYIGIWVNDSIELHPEANPLIILITDYLPLPVAILFSIGLISALISSADTCLMSTAIILGNDILKKKSIYHTRIFIALIGIVALALALFKGNIIGLLLGAYSVYVPGVVLPLSVGIYFYKKRKINHTFLFTGIVLGSLLGLLSNILKIPNLAIYGVMASALLSIMSVYIKNTPYVSNKIRSKTQ